MVTKKQTLLLIGLGVLLLIAVVATVFIVLSRQSAVSEATKNIFAGSTDAVTYTDINGSELSLEDFLGQVLVVTSWASWSPFTATDLTSLNLIAADYSNDEIVFMAINRKETKDQAARLLATLPEFPLLKIIIDTEDHFYRGVEGYAMPETVVFDTRGEVVLHVRGVLNAAEVKGAIETALAKE